VEKNRIRKEERIAFVVLKYSHKEKTKKKETNTEEGWTTAFPHLSFFFAFRE
jgi:hypothetical protein